MATFLLIHGGGHGGWCWDKVVPLLKARGHRVLAPDLPGMGDDKTPLADATLANWARFVCDLAGAQGEPVVLVGHSLGGRVIGEAAELDPHRVLGLIYLSAILQPAGLSTMDALTDPDPILLRNVRPTDAGDGIIFDPESAKAAFYHCATPQDAERAAQRLCPQPLEATFAPQTVTAEGWGSLPRAYIECADDRTCSLAVQRKMQAVLPCDPVITLGGDHSPFLSQPEAVAGHLADIAALFLSRR